MVSAARLWSVLSMTTQGSKTACSAPSVQDLLGLELLSDHDDVKADRGQSSSKEFLCATARAAL